MRQAKLFLSNLFELDPSSRSRMSSMEGLRGLAILMVFFCHYYNIIWDNTGLSENFQRFGTGVMWVGGSGVELFFVLSGMLIYKAVTKPTLNYATFMRRRAERIYPAFLAMFAIYLALNLAPILLHRPSTSYEVRIPANPLSAVAYVIANVMFLPGLFPIQPLMNVAWTLSYEWFFYISLPFVVMLFGLRQAEEGVRYRRIRIFIIIAALVIAGYMAFPVQFYDHLNPVRHSHVRVVMFLAGMAICEFGQTSAVKRFFTAAREKAVIALFALSWLAVFACAWRYYDVDQHALIIPRLDAWGVAWIFPGFGLFVLFTLYGSGVLNRFFSFSVMRWLGNMSYSYYLAHGFVLHLIAGFIRKPWGPHPSGAAFTSYLFVMMVPAFITTAVGSAVLFGLIEKPFSLKPHKPNRAVNTPDVTSPEATRKPDAADATVPELTYPHP